MAKSTQQIPEGCPRVCPFIITSSNAKLIGFTTAAFGASERTRAYNEEGQTIGHAEDPDTCCAFEYVAVSEIRVDNANVVVLPHSVTVHRMPPAIQYSKVEWRGGLNTLRHHSMGYLATA